VRAALLLAALVLAGCQRTPPAARATATDTALVAPDGSRLLDDDMARSVLRGRALLRATGDSLPDHTGNALRCVSCHLDDGRGRDAIPLTGVYSRFPQYRSRVGAVQRLEDRINDCFARSLNGSPLAWDDPAMRDIVAYLAFISRGVAVGDSTRFTLDTALAGDTVAGRRRYTATCARCHQENGTGTGAYPPLWGPMSFDSGAGMARMRTFTAFIHRNMPFDQPGTLPERDAIDIAAYVLAHGRPDFRGKEHDWPRGGAPPDVPYHLDQPIRH
jgi:thiosulfate dehydrogenase